MAEANVSVSQDRFSCPVCLDLLKNPVTIPCGHSFCMECIADCWDGEDLKGVYSCPQCRQTFTPRPVLCRNTMMVDMVEMLDKSGNRSDSPPLTCHAEPGDVECGVCTGRKQKAVKSCLVCLSSYCETHFKAHNDLFPGKKHKVVEADGKLEDLICTQHDKLLEVFCRTDQKCICLQCVMDGHSGHNTVSVAAERTEKQRDLGQGQKKHKQTIEGKQEHLEELKEAVRVMKSAQGAVEDTEGIFAEMIRSIQRRCSEVTKLIRDKEKADVTQAEGRLKKLEQEIAELKRRDAKLERLSKTQDHTRFLQGMQSLCISPDQGHSSPDIRVCSNVTFEKVTQSVSQLKDKLEDLLKQGARSIAENVKLIRLFRLWEPLARQDFLKCWRQLHLDPITAQNNLHLSEGNKAVTWKDELQQRPDNPERFDHWQQVLCKESVSGRCYWEVEWSGLNVGSKEVFIGLSSKAITRKGSRSKAWFGYNEHSWSLSCSHSSCSFIHNRKETRLKGVPSSRIGVYLDHKAGILSFYSIHGDKSTLLHKIQTTFTQPLYPGFWILPGSEVHISLCK
ncbi:tripartite motif-containing protein 16-like protein isoform X2 [Engraulis encrasicolus]|uniref:tripartite motif-containing protein 16-like protein isoform X2 n=1 Tax=Engraulis encrasicolus TaxID=184585 RepID=UPI002FCF34AC